MARILKIAFKEITDAEFLAINIQNKGSSTIGGGQSYIDFQASAISEGAWDAFFQGLAVKRVSPRGWIFDVRSLGTSKPPQKQIELSYRDAPKLTRFGLREQKHPDISSKGRRLFAWRPEVTGFPALPAGVATKAQLPAHVIADLRIFLIRDDEDRIWAGWRKGPPPPDMPPLLAPMFANPQGMIEISGALELDETNLQWPFEVESPSEGPEWDDDDNLDVPEPGIKYSLQKIRQRNQAAAKPVRKLYDRCQITGDEFLFLTKKGKPYLEVHHLIALGRGGADLPRNMVVLSAHAHKMLHHATVSPIDLSKIADNKLNITINGKAYTITWHPKHAAVVQSHNPA